MNNKGQTLVLFVALLPFVFILFVFVFDLAFIASQKTKLDSVANSALSNIIVKNKDIEKVKEIIVKNDNEIKITKIDLDSVCLKKSVSPVFGHVIGYDKYDIKSCISGKLINGKLIIEEKGK